MPILSGYLQLDSKRDRRVIFSGRLHRWFSTSSCSNINARREFARPMGVNDKGGLGKPKLPVATTLGWINVASPKLIPSVDRLAIGRAMI